MLTAIGGLAGVALGAAATAVYAHAKGWAVIIPPLAWAGGLTATLLIGIAEGLLPALRAALLSPTQALWNLQAPSRRWTLPARSLVTSCQIPHS